MRTKLKSWPGDIRFWLIIFFLIRLTGITHPPLEAGHHWRQVTGLMVARNFLETDARIFYPQIDDHNGKSAVIGMEFPLLNYMHFLLSLLASYEHWYGRLINLIFSSLGIWFFYLLLKKYAGKQTAFYSSLALLTSIWFAFSRKMMPDTFCISLMMMALWTGLKYLSEGRRYHLLLFILTSTLAILVKIPAGIYLSVFALPLLSKTINRQQKLFFALSIIPVLAAVYYWYFVWNPHLAKEFGNWYNSGMTVGAGFRELTGHLPAVFKKFYFEAFSGFIFSVIAFAGIVTAIVNKQKMLLAASALVSIVFLAYMIKSGYYFHHHTYYIIPFVPVMALLLGLFLTSLKSRLIAHIILAAGMAEGIANQQHDFFLKESEKYKLGLEEFADSVSERKDLIAVNGNGNPQQMYLAHRKGWTCTNEMMKDTVFVESIRKKGCRFLFVNLHELPDSLPYTLCADNGHYRVYALGR